jgi:hypothetical protein
MTIEDLANLDGDELRKLTPEQLDIILRPYYPLTRPEQRVRKEPEQPKQTLMSTLTPAKRAALAELAQEGLDLSFMQRKIKKK